MQTLHLPSRIYFTLLAACIGGCGDHPLTPGDLEGHRPDVRQYVTAELASSLDVSGNFRFDVVPSWAERDLLGIEEATEIARAVINTWYANENVVVIPGTEPLTRGIELQHGRPIRWKDLSTEMANSFLAEPSFDSLQRMEQAAFHRFGPQFTVAFFDGIQPVLTVVVSGSSTDVRIGAGGLIESFGTAGADFDVIGIPYSSEEPIPPSPETAVEFVWRSTGVRTAEMPRLVLPARRLARAYARWRVKLEREIIVTRLRDGMEIQTDEIYVGLIRSISEEVSQGAYLRLFHTIRTFDELVVDGQTFSLRPGLGFDYSEVAPR